MDDFVVTYFTKGAGINTISTMLYQQLRRGINPQMYALSTLLFLTILILLGLINHMSATKQKKADRDKIDEFTGKILSAGKRKADGRYFRPRSIVNYLNHCLYRLLFFWKKSDDKNTVTVFNYGDYIDVSVLKTFEKETASK